MAYTTQYIGSRYVPVFADPAEWNNTRTYEPLTIVLHEGNSYTSRQYVPVGVELTNTDYWLETGNYNAQLEQYRRAATNNMKVFQTAANMQSSNTISEGDICQTEGFNTVGDIGNGTYIISASATANGYDVLQCKNGLTASLIISSEINIKTLGVMSSNRAMAVNNTNAIARAVAISSNIYIPRGTYYISNTINITVNQTVHSDNAILLPICKQQFDCFSVGGINIADEAPTFNIFYGNLSIKNFRYGLVLNENAANTTNTIMGVINNISFRGNIESIRCYAINVYNLTIKNCTFGNCTYGFRWYAPNNVSSNAGEKIIFDNLFTGNCDAIFKLESIMEIWVINSSLDYSACAFYITSANVSTWCSNCHIEGIGNSDRGSSSAYHGFYYNDHGTSGILTFDKCLFYQRNDAQFTSSAYTNITFNSCYISGGYTSNDSQQMYLINNAIPIVHNTTLASKGVKVPAPRILNQTNPNIVINNITKSQILEKGYTITGSNQAAVDNIVVSTDSTDVFEPNTNNASLVLTNGDTAIDTLYISFPSITKPIPTMVMALIALKYPTETTASYKVSGQTGRETSQTLPYYTFDKNNRRDGWVMNIDGTKQGLTFIDQQYSHLLITLRFQNIPANGVIKIGNLMFLSYD